MKSDWHKTSPVQERLELSQFAIEEKQSYSNFQEIDSCTIDLKVSVIIHSPFFRMTTML